MQPSDLSIPVAGAKKVSTSNQFPNVAFNSYLFNGAGIHVWAMLPKPTDDKDPITADFVGCLSLVATTKDTPRTVTLADITDEQKARDGAETAIANVGDGVLNATYGSNTIEIPAGRAVSFAVDFVNKLWVPLSSPGASGGGGSQSANSGPIIFSGSVVPDDPTFVYPEGGKERGMLYLEIDWNQSQDPTNPTDPNSTMDVSEVMFSFWPPNGTAWTSFDISSESETQYKHDQILYSRVPLSTGVGDPTNRNFTEEYETDNLYLDTASGSFWISPKRGRTDTPIWRKISQGGGGSVTPTGSATPQVFTGNGHPSTALTYPIPGLGGDSAVMYMDTTPSTYDVTKNKPPMTDSLAGIYVWPANTPDDGGHGSWAQVNATSKDLTEWLSYSVQLTHKIFLTGLGDPQDTNPRDMMFDPKPKQNELGYIAALYLDGNNGDIYGWVQGDDAITKWTKIGSIKGGGGGTPITIDTVPTTGSPNAVSSDGVAHDLSIVKLTLRGKADLGDDGKVKPEQLPPQTGGGGGTLSELVTQIAKIQIPAPQAAGATYTVDHNFTADVMIIAKDQTGRTICTAGDVPESLMSFDRFSDGSFNVTFARAVTDLIDLVIMGSSRSAPSPLNWIEIKSAKVKVPAFAIGVTYAVSHPFKANVMVKAVDSATGREISIAGDIPQGVITLSDFADNSFNVLFQATATSEIDLIVMGAMA
jgi:hypothetical protein